MAVEDGAVSCARIAFGGVANLPFRAMAAEQDLHGAEPTDEAFARAADTALADAEPLAHNAYTVPLARALVRRV